MIRNLGPLLLIPDQNPRLIERLDFRPDLQRGDKGVIYRELARMLCSGLSCSKADSAKTTYFDGLPTLDIRTWAQIFKAFNVL